MSVLDDKTISTLKKLRINADDFEVRCIIGRGHFGEVRYIILLEQPLYVQLWGLGTFQPIAAFDHYHGCYYYHYYYFVVAMFVLYYLFVGW